MAYGGSHLGGGMFRSYWRGHLHRRRPTSRATFGVGAVVQLTGGIAVAFATTNAAAAETSAASANAAASAATNAAAYVDETSAGSADGIGSTSAAPSAGAPSSASAAGAAASSGSGSTQNPASASVGGSSDVSAAPSVDAPSSASASGAAATAARADSAGDGRASADAYASAVASALTGAPASALSEGLAAAISAALAQAGTGGTASGQAGGVIAGSEIVYGTGGIAEGVATAFAQALSACVSGGSASGVGTAFARADSLGDARASAQGSSDPSVLSNSAGDGVAISVGVAGESVGVVLAPSSGSGSADAAARATAAAIAGVIAGGTASGFADSWQVEIVLVPVGLLESNSRTIRRRFRDRVSNPLSIRVAQDNAPFVPAVDEVWSRFEVDLGRLEHLATGAGNRFRKRGECRAFFYAPVQLGTADAIAAADRFVEQFRNASDGVVRFGTPEYGARRREGPYFVVPVSCPFWDDVFVPAESSSSGTISGVADIENVARTRFRDLVSTPRSLPVAWPNAPGFVPNPREPWVSFAVLPGESFVAELGSIKTYRIPGVVMLKIRVPVEDGDARARRIADWIFESFRAVRDRGVLFRSPTAGAGKREGPWWTVNVEVPFLADVRAA